MKEISISGKILSVALGLISWMVILAGMFIASSEDAFAATDYPLYVGGVQFKSGNLVIDRNDNPDFSGKAEYDPDTMTLTLNNFNNGGWTYTFTQGGSYGESDGIYYKGNDDLNIVLVGDNTITCNLTGTESAKYYNKFGLTSEEDVTVTITGDSLTVESGDTPSGGAFPILAGISVKNKLVINSGRITARGGNCNLRYSYGIQVGYIENEGILEVNGGYVKAEAGSITGDNSDARSYGISSRKTVEVRGGIVEAIGGDTYNGKSKGIYSENTSWFSGGKTIAKAGGGGSTTSYGIAGAVHNADVRNDAILIASGNTKAAESFIWHSVPGFGWDNVDGTGTRNAIPANPSGQAYSYKKLRFPDKYLVTVINGSGGGFYNENDTVTVTADPPATGKEFFKWVRDDGRVLADERAESTTLVMPGEDITVTAVYKDAEVVPETFEVKVTGGSGSGRYKEGDTVEIKADPPEEGKVFDKWTTEDEISFKDAGTESTSFIMPARDVSVTAGFKDKEKEEEKKEDSSPSENKLIDRVPPTGSEKYASPEDNFAPVTSGGKIKNMVLDFSNVGKSDVKPGELKMTAIRGSKFTTAAKLAEGGTASGSGGVKVKVNKKNRTAAITVKSDGSATLQMEDSVTYTIAFKVDKPKGVKTNISAGSAPVIKSIKELFGTDIDAGELSVAKQKHSQASLSGNTLIVDPKEADSIKTNYKYLNKTYKATIKIK